MEAKKKYMEEKRKKADFFSFKEISMANIETGYHDIEFIVNREKQDTDIAIYVLSRMSGEGADRKLIEGDFLLSKQENEDIHYLASTYKDVILIINAGGMIDLSPLYDITLSGLIFTGMLGEEGGNAFADIISGAITPSGHLADTRPMSYKDIPFGENYSYLNGNEKEEEYSEDIYVGYRYYERFRKKVRYAFGYGLSYTGFKIATKVDLQDEIKIFVKLKNFGNFKGKCVLQIYASLPE
jgi:beta-glucosidase